VAALFIVWIGILLCASIIWRGLTSRCFETYPFFYSYICGMLAEDVGGLCVYSRFPAFYRSVYWVGESLTLALSCGIIFEIFRHVLRAYPGPRKFARAVGIIAFGIILIIFFATSPLFLTSSSINGRMEQLETNLRSVQALFLTVVIALIGHYGIRLGKNMRGMIGGYAFLIAATLVNITMYSHSSGRFAEFWGILVQIGYAIPLFVWLAGLWSYQPNPEDGRNAQIEQDYDRLTVRMNTALGIMKGYLGKGIGP
jgi:hypothetical protein